MALPAAPSLLSEALLRERALESCRKHVEATLEGEYRVEPLPAGVQWDLGSLRHVFDQQMVVWRALSGFDVLLDDRDRPVGFVDEDKWAECAWREMPQAEAVALARATGLVPEELPLASTARGEKDCAELVFAVPRRPGGVRVRLNPARGAVISVEPLPGGTP